MNDIGDFLEIIKSLRRIPEVTFLVTVDIVGLYSSIPHDAQLKAFYEKLEQKSDKKVLYADLVDMTKFLLKDNFFEFDSKVKQQISDTAIGTIFAPSYAWAFMDKVETDFVETLTVNSLVLESIWLGLRYTLLYVNVDHLVVTKVDVRLALMLKIQTFFRVSLQRGVTI